MIEWNFGEIIERIFEEELNKMEFKLKVSKLKEGLSPTTDILVQMATIKKRLIKRLRDGIYRPAENNTLVLYLNDERETPCFLMQRGKIKLRISKDDARNLFSLTEPKFAETMYYLQVWGSIIKDCYKAITNLEYEIKIESV